MLIYVNNSYFYERKNIWWMKENTIVYQCCNNCGAVGIERSDCSPLLSASHVWNTVLSYGSSRSNSDKAEWLQWRGTLNQDGQDLGNLHCEEGLSGHDWHTPGRRELRLSVGRGGGAETPTTVSEGIIKDTDVDLVLKCSGGKQGKLFTNRNREMSDKI